MSQHNNKSGEVFQNKLNFNTDLIKKENGIVLFINISLYSCHHKTREFTVFLCSSYCALNYYEHCTFYTLHIHVHIYKYVRIYIYIHTYIYIYNAKMHVLGFIGST